MVSILQRWLFQVASHRCLDELRRRLEVPFSTLEREDGEEGLSPLEAIADPEPLPGEMIESNDLHGSLPPKFRSMMHLRCLRQLTFAEIGRLLNMQETTVKTSFYRALPRLRRVLANSVASVSLRASP